MKKLLLLLGNIAQSTAADYAAMGDRTGAAAVVDRIGAVRAAIVAAPRHEQRRATVDALARALSDWMEADWLLQSTWRDGRPPRPRRVTLHRRTIVDLSYGTRPAAPSFADRVRALAKYAVVALPPVYGDVLSELLPRFPAWQSPRFSRV